MVSRSAQSLFTPSPSPSPSHLQSGGIPPRIPRGLLRGKWVREILRSPSVALALGALGIALGTILGERRLASPLFLYGANYISGAQQEERAPYTQPKPDAAVILSVLPDTFFSALASETAKPHPPGALTLLVTERIPSSDLIEFLGVYPKELPSFWTGGVHLYLWTQQQNPHQDGTGGNAKIVAVIPYYEEALPRYEGLFQKTLIENSPMLLMKPHSQKIEIGFARAEYRGAAVHYINAPTPDTALDYAFLPEQKVFIFAASREAMHAIIDRLVE